jgi:hypothetical protein
MASVGTTSTRSWWRTKRKPVVGTCVEISKFGGCHQMSLIPVPVHMLTALVVVACVPDSMVPRSFPENPKLGRWVYTQRTRYTQYALSPDRVAKLDDLGFVWKIFARSNWHDCYQQLVDFKQAYGHCRVPRQYDENRKLGSWVQTQRTEMKYRKMGRPSRMTEDRIELLNDLRFEWKVNQTKELGSFTASG